jgi:hypothetical protein
MAYLVLHQLQHGRVVSPPGQPVLEKVRIYEPGELFEPLKGEDITHLLESGTLALDDEEGRARARAIAQTRESVKRPFGLL